MGPAARGHDLARAWPYSRRFGAARSRSCASQAPIHRHGGWGRRGAVTILREPGPYSRASSASRRRSRSSAGPPSRSRGVPNTLPAGRLQPWRDGGWRRHETPSRSCVSLAPYRASCLFAIRFRPVGLVQQAAGGFLDLHGAGVRTYQCAYSKSPVTSQQNSLHNRSCSSSGPATTATKINGSSSRVRMYQFPDRSPTSISSKFDSVKASLISETAIVAMMGSEPPNPQRLTCAKPDPARPRCSTTTSGSWWRPSVS